VIVVLSPKMTVADVMRPAPIVVSVRCTLAEFLRERYDYRHHCYPVVDSGRPIGLLHAADVERVAAQELAGRVVGAHALRPPKVAIIEADRELGTVLEELDAAGADEALVLDHGRPVGILLAGEARARLDAVAR
jgi:predicted transcriptional regulator